MDTIYDRILWLQSQATNKRFPIVQFSGDTDMVTNGWVSLTSIERPEIVVTQTIKEEYFSRGGDYQSSLQQVEQRANRELNRADLRCSWLVRAERLAPSGKVLSFQGFREAYRPPKLFFRDIFSNDSLAEEVNCVSRAEFERDGGKLIVLNNKA